MITNEHENSSKFIRWHDNRGSGQLFDHLSPIVLIGSRTGVTDKK